MMARAAWLTWKMHRFEVLAVLAMTGLLALSTAIVTGHITGLGSMGACWPRTDGAFTTTGCDDLMNRFWSVANAEGSYVRIGLALVAPIAGLIIGVPIVARELELRTTAFAWSLEGIRWRWLAARALPMVLVTLAGLLVLGVAAVMFFEALGAGHQMPALTEVASQGTALVGRGFLALGIALLVGSIMGRTLPAFLIAAIAVVLWSTVGVGLVQDGLARQYSAWAPGANDGWRDGIGPLAYIDSGQFDVTRPGVDGEPGMRLRTSAQIDRLIAPTCGVQPPDDGSGTENECYETAVSSLRWMRIVPGSRFGDFVAVDALLSLVIGGAAMVGTVVVVSRRRAA